MYKIVFQQYIKCAPTKYTIPDDFLLTRLAQEAQKQKKSKYMKTNCENRYLSSFFETYTDHLKKIFYLVRLSNHNCYAQKFMYARTQTICL